MLCSLRFTPGTLDELSFQTSDGHGVLKVPCGAALLLPIAARLDSGPEVQEEAVLPSKVKLHNVLRALKPKPKLSYFLKLFDS